MPNILATQTDEMLMARIERGFQDAFEELMSRYERAVITFCYSFVRDHARAEDLAQETFLRVYRAAARYKPTAKFTTWLYTIAANLSINALKKEKIRRTLSLDEPVGIDESGSRIIEKVAGNNASPLTEVENRELQEIIAGAIARLPEDQRTTLTLVEYHHLSYKEIAEVLDVTVSAIKMRVKRARETLREMLSILEPHKEED